MRERIDGNLSGLSFTEIASVADGLVENFPRFIDERKSSSFRYETPFKSRYQNSISIGHYLEITLSLPNYTSSLDKPRIFILDSPENTATTIGRLKYDENDKIFHFVPARFHTGYLAVKDMSYAMKDSFKIEPFINYMSPDIQDDPESKMFMVHIAREGPMMNVESGFFRGLHLNIPYTIVHSEHQKVDDPKNQFGRIAKVCNINFEGLDSQNIKTVVIADNTASGMQHVEVLRKVVEHIRNVNGSLTDKPSQFLIFSPLLTDYGLLTISMFAESLGIKVVFVTSSTILKCLPPKRYFSPVSNTEELFVNPQHSTVNEFALGELSGKICSRCNWTASFSATKAAALSSEAELQQYGWDNEKLIKQSKLLTIKKMQEVSIDPRNYISYATLEEAKYFKALKQLEKELQ